tara:strand:- start:48 stop:269 length:222 start_codon:yes stop_codon:yes gene_type:complete
MDADLEEKIFDVLGHERLTVREVVEGLECEGYYEKRGVIGNNLRTMWCTKQLDRTTRGYGDLVYWNPSTVLEE